MVSSPAVASHVFLYSKSGQVKRKEGREKREDMHHQHDLESVSNGEIVAFKKNGPQ